jgi:drug/metabolite transporter (DMT)-like permease
VSNDLATAGSITITHVLQENLYGCPIGFALTAMQQVISFLCFIIAYAVLYPTEYKLNPKQIKSKFEVFSICIFAAVFALNIALNNTSLEYISIAVNLIIRSCLPLTTFLSQQGLAMMGLYTFKPCNVKEIALMFAGVVCAGAFTAAKIAGSAHSGQSSSNAVLGVLICIASLLCGSLNLALAGVLGEMKLSVIDTVAYMSVPATIFLLFFCFWPKSLPDGEWREVFGSDQASNWQVLQMVANIAPGTFALFVLSGVFSFIYNIIQFNIVHTLSPSATAFGGNFNKAALVFLTLILPFLQVHSLPGAPYIYVIWAAVIGNVLAFSAYSYLQIKAKEERARKDAEMKGLPTDEKTAFASDKELEEWSEIDSSSDDGAVC